MRTDGGFSPNEEPPAVEIREKDPLQNENSAAGPFMPLLQGVRAEQGRIGPVEDEQPEFHVRLRL